jgi:hypothetical protein
VLREPIKERRRHARHPCHGPIDFRIQGWYLRRGRILNLCLDGCLIESQVGTDCVPGDQIEMRFKVNQLTFLAQCIVRRVQSSGDLGIEILSLSDRSRRQLQELIDELAAMCPASKS